MVSCFVMFVSKHDCKFRTVGFCFMNLHVFLCLGPISGVLHVALNEPSYVPVFRTY